MITSRSQAQNGTEWVPTSQQAKFLEAATECGFDRNLTAVAKAAGVPRRTVYNWLERDEGFKNSWENLWKTTLSRHVPGVVAALVKRAQGGDPTAAKLVLEMAGILKRGQQAESRGPTLEDLLAGVRPPIPDQ